MDSCFQHESGKSSMCDLEILHVDAPRRLSVAGKKAFNWEKGKARAEGTSRNVWLRAVMGLGQANGQSMALTEVRRGLYQTSELYEHVQELSTFPLALIFIH
jgi:hypothetical protein